MILPLKLLGYFGPYILNVLSLILLLTYTRYNEFIFYVLGMFVNSIINFIIKVIVKNPRPKEDKGLFDSGKNINKSRASFDKYGFPSGHSQSCAYSLSFMFMILKNVYLVYFYIFIMLFTSYQRVENKNHTVIQIIGGMGFGLLVGYIMYMISKKYDVYNKIKMVV